MTNTVFSSLTRIADVASAPYDTRRLPRSEWASGDYVVGEVTGTPTSLYNIEDAAGVMIPVSAGDIVVGAFGNRAATLEGVGSFDAIRDDKMHALTSAGLFGAFTSTSEFMPTPLSLRYIGHVTRHDRKVTMREFAVQASQFSFEVPTILLVGTSMSAGKTVAGRAVIKELSTKGLKIIGAKLTGAGRLRDILSYKKKGAAEIFDFVDAGLPSTVVPEDEFRAALRPLLSSINDCRPDFLVAEAGASPLEPYNGAAAIDELGDNIKCTILCASDPYAVVGVQQAFGLKPDLVTGPTANTSAGIDLVKKLTGLPAINIHDTDSIQDFRDFLEKKLEL